MNPDKPAGTRAPRRPTRTFSLIATAAITAALLAACGGSSSSSTTTSGSVGGGSSPSPTAASNKAEQFAQCMRTHGAANFPDPTAQGTFQLPTSLTSSPQFRTADAACKSLAPAGALQGQAPTTAELNKALNFVHCMRNQGVNLPDPTTKGVFKVNPTTIGIDPNSPQFKQALYRCRSLLPPGTGFGTGH
jgi:hypothetical protein